MVECGGGGGSGEGGDCGVDGTFEGVRAHCGGDGKGEGKGGGGVCVGRLWGRGSVGGLEIGKRDLGPHPN